jgi:hypothetical protein
MSNTKQLPSPSPDDLSSFTANWIKEYARQVVKYTLEQAAEKSLVRCYSTEGKDESTKDFFYFVDADETVKVDEKSILSLEEQIIKDLNL